MTELTDLTLAEARDGLAASRFSSTEITRAHLDAVEKAQALNAYVLETPERALAMAEVSDAQDRQGRGAAARRAAARRQGPVLHPRRRLDRLLQHPARLRAALRIDRHRTSSGATAP